MNGGSAQDGGADDGRLGELIAPLRENPDRSAVLTDVDGTIAPIESEPGAAAVPEGTRRLLRALAERYALVGCLSGRRAIDARRVVGLDELAYSGNHGFELLLPGDTEVRPDPSLDAHEADAPRFVNGLDRARLERAGIRTEDKGAIVALHWRGAPNEAAAESLAQEIASEAEWEGLIPHRGRKVLEIRPNVAINKGIAVAALIPARPVDRALYGGDDRTDVDAFAALRTLQENGELETAVCIAVDSDESPPEVSEAADLTVPGPEGFVRVLEALAE
ncbi:MAG TPA: trehalose-phosphatase [Solirubrobacterales bacterium]|nr:trehalose-phosphatase [Solirubrobacterales bacterium]